jgi:hypothetical protein
MKQTFKYIIAAAAFSAMALVSDSSAFAQNLPDGVYLEKDGLAFRKSATLKEGTTDRYIIDLEAFVTGEVTVKNTSIPADIVLVLDVSGSMDETMYTPITGYTARSRQAYTYNSYGSNTFYYLHTDGNYYPVSRDYYTTGFIFGTNHYNLSFTASNGTTYYLSGTGVTTNRPSNPTSATSTIWTGVLYTAQGHEPDGTKMSHLKEAVKKFIEEIKYNDEYDEKGERRKDAQGNDTYLGNQISIVKFAGDRYVGNVTGYNNANAPLTEGNNTYQDGYYTYNYTQVVKGFTSTKEGGATTLKNAVDALNASGATSADYGLNLARRLIENLPKEGEEGDRSGSTKTVVFFTDGSPTHESDFQTTVASQAIDNAYYIKNSGATVWTIGVFDEYTDQIDNFMNYTSSNYPGARSMSQPGNKTGSNFYQNASNANLSDIFQSIAEASGGSGNTDVTAESSVTVDVVASSFAIPENTKPADITVLVAPCVGLTEEITYNGETKRYLDFGEAKAPSAYNLPAITPTVDPATNTVSTEGFDFSEHWCGLDEEHNIYRGYKQIIRFEITTAEGAVGGPNVATNDKKSGIYVNGNQIAEFNRPTVKIPINIWIKKMGLVGEDSAVFTISYAAYQPNVDPMSLPSTAWKNFTKMMITKDSPVDTDGYPMEKLSGLDPDFFYRIKEDAWAWSYDYQDDGIQYTVGENLQNPFIFVNVPKEDFKEGEATVRNVFKKKEKTNTNTTEQ